MSLSGKETRKRQLNNISISDKKRRQIRQSKESNRRSDIWNYIISIIINFLGCITK